MRRRLHTTTELSPGITQTTERPARIEAVWADGLRAFFYGLAAMLFSIPVTFLASDLVIVPCATDYLSSEGAARTFDTMKVLRDLRKWHGRVLGILPTFHDERTKESAATLADLRETFGKRLVLIPIHQATVLRECAAEGATIWEKALKSRAATEYAQLVWRLHDGT